MWPISREYNLSLNELLRCRSTNKPIQFNDEIRFGAYFPSLLVSWLVGWLAGLLKAVRLLILRACTTTITVV